MHGQNDLVLIFNMIPPNDDHDNLVMMVVVISSLPGKRRGTSHFRQVIKKAGKKYHDTLRERERVTSNAWCEEAFHQ